MQKSTRHRRRLQQTDGQTAAAAHSLCMSTPSTSETPVPVQRSELLRQNARGGGGGGAPRALSKSIQTDSLITINNFCGGDTLIETSRNETKRNEPKKKRKTCWRGNADCCRIGETVTSLHYRTFRPAP